MADASALAASDILDEVRGWLDAAAGLKAMAREVNAIGARAPRGGQWTAAAVKRASEPVVKAARPSQS